MARILSYIVHLACSTGIYARICVYIHTYTHTYANSYMSSVSHSHVCAHHINSRIHAHYTDPHTCIHAHTYAYVYCLSQTCLHICLLSLTDMPAHITFKVDLYIRIACSYTCKRASFSVSHVTNESTHTYTSHVRMISSDTRA